MDTERYERCCCLVWKDRKLTRCGDTAVEWSIAELYPMMIPRCAKHLNTFYERKYHSLQDALAALAMERL